MARDVDTTPLSWPIPDFGFNIKHYVVCVRPFIGVPHLHSDTLEIQYILSGRGRYYINGQFLHLQPRKIFLFGPGKPHYFLRRAPDDIINHAGIYVKLGGLPELAPAVQAVLGDLIGAATAHPHILPQQAESKRLEKLVELMEDEWRRKASGYRLAVCSLLSTFLIQLRRCQESSSATKPKPKPNLVIDRALPLIEERFASDISLGSLAAELGLSTFSLSRRFREATGIAFNDFLVRKRVHNACRRLEREPHVSVIEIAFNCGYNELTTFNRNFRKIMGQTPTQYRNKCLIGR